MYFFLGHQVEETHYASHNVYGWHNQNSADRLSHYSKRAVQRFVWKN